jgi:protein-L-isoaspartate(D-aspartate) O-methyltransferase
MNGQHGGNGHEAAERRAQMVIRQLAERGIQDIRVLEAMGEVPRERFVAPDVRPLAYEDCALPIAEGQTISQPYMVAAMCEALQLRGPETVLEIGTGSGYAAAVLSRLARRVVSIERHPALAERAAALLRELGYTNVDVYLADGSRGWPTEAPYDVITVAAGAPTVPDALIRQLRDGGRLLIPVGEPRQQVLTRITRAGDRLYKEELMPCVFVPLIGAHGWSGPE